MNLCENSIPSRKIKCTEEAIDIDVETQMYLCFWCWWDSLIEMTQNALIRYGLQLPKDNRPEGFR